MSNETTLAGRIARLEGLRESRVSDEDFSEAMEVIRQLKERLQVIRRKINELDDPKNWFPLEMAHAATDLNYDFPLECDFESDGDEK